MMHHLPSTNGSILVGLRQVLKEKFHGAGRMSLSEVVAGNAHVCLDGMDKSIHARIGNQGLRKIVAEGTVNDGNIWSHAVAEKRILVSSLGNNRKWSDFTSCTTGGGNTNQLVNLGSSVREGTGPLPKLNKPCANILKLSLRMLIEHADTLGSIHRRATTKSDQNLWLELFACCCTSSHTLNCWIRGNLIKHSNLETDLLKHHLDLGAVPELNHSSVCDNHGAGVPLASRIGLGKVCNGFTSAVAVEVQVWGCLHPFHVFLTRGHQLHVDQGRRGQVGCNRRTSSGTHSESETGRNVEVECSADSSNARWDIGKQVMCRHSRSECSNSVLIIGVDNSSVSFSTKVNNGCTKILGLVE
mmetsp:Transcript_16076/g.36760  ORF Transcript_16076/g.36760 Transcript_16076/m.36760 type:complete len:357 (-) Transcript_16076:601-1671(-)